MDISSALSAGSFPLDDRNEPVYLERDGHTAAIVLNRPDKLNAITRHMWMRLYQAITTSSADTSLRCIVLRSTSPKAFSPGCDIHEFSVCRANKAQAREYGELMHRTLEAFENCPVPVIAEIRGLCVGAGLELAAVCDIRLCCESSRFGAPIKKSGAPLATRWHKRFIRRLADPSPVTPQEYDECFDCFDTTDYSKGYHAFINRSLPDFEGK